MNLIITGADGFIGRAIVREFLKFDCFIYSLVGPNYKNDMLENERIKIIKFDLLNKLDENHLIKGKKIDLFIHLAWIGTSGLLRTDYTHQQKNINILLNVIEYCKKNNIKRFVGAGSIIEDETYFGTNSSIIRLPTSYIYGSSKLMAHTIAKIFCNNNNIEFVWPKITNTYGPGEISPRFINTTLRKIIRNENLEFSQATQNYDFIHIDDLANIFVKLAFDGNNNENYLIGSGEAKPLKEFILEILSISNFKGKFTFSGQNTNIINLPLSSYSINTVIRDIKINKQISFKNGITQTLRWIQNESKI